MTAAKKRDDYGDKRLAKLLEKEAQIIAQRQAMEAKVRLKARKEETRQRILLGAFCLYMLDRDTPQSRKLRDVLAADFPEFLTRPHDKQVMGSVLDDLRSGFVGDVVSDD